MIGKDYPQTATYWANPVYTGFGGASFDAPKVIKVRWEEKSEEFHDETTGEQRISRSVVYVQEDLDLGAFIMQGSHTDLAPEALDDIWRIKKFTKIPDIRNASNERKVLL